MELRQLRHFIAVLEAGSFSRAADQLHLTPQALSKSISALEDSLGVRLLDRTSRHVSMTTYGEMLYAHATNITAEAAQFTRQLDDVLGIKSGRLLIGAGPTAAGRLIAPTIDKLRRMLPRLHVSVVDGAADTLIPMLLRGQLDVIVCLMNEDIEDPMVEQETLFLERLVFVAGPHHPLVGRTRVPLASVVDFPWLLGWNAGAVDGRVLAAMEAQRIEPPVRRLSTTSVQFARALLGQGEFVAVLPEDLFADDIRAGLLATLDVDVDSSSWRRPVKLVYRRKSTRSPATMAFVGALRTVLPGAEPPRVPSSNSRVTAFVKRKST